MSMYAYIVYINNGHSLTIRPQPISIRVSSSLLGRVARQACICATTCGAKARRRRRKCGEPGWNGRFGRPPMHQHPSLLPAASRCLSRCWLTWSFRYSVILPMGARGCCNSLPLSYSHSLSSRHSVDPAVLHSTTDVFSPLSPPF